MKIVYSIRSYWIFLALMAIGFAITAPPALHSFRLYADAIAYENIARNMAAGNGFTSTLKLNYFGSSGITHFAMPDWPPLYPFSAGILEMLGLPGTGLQVVSALLMALSAGMVFLIGEKLFNRRAGLIAGIMAAIAPNVHRAGILAMSDAPGLALTLAAILIALHANGRAVRWAAVGAIAGAAYLTRFPNAVLMIAFIPFLLSKREERLNALACAVGFAVMTSPVFIWKWLLYGSPNYSIQMFHYSTSSFRESSWESYNAPQTKASLGFLMRSRAQIVSLIWQNLTTYTANLFYHRIGLRLLALGLPLLALGKKRAALNRERGLVLSIAVMNFAVYPITWSIPPQGVRFLLVAYCLLLPFCAAGFVWAMDRFGKPASALTALCCCVTAFLYIAQYPALERTAEQFGTLDPQITNWIEKSLKPETAIATNNPWLVVYETNRPTAALPHNLDSKMLEHFQRDYSIGAYVILNTDNESPTLKTLKSKTDRFTYVKLRSAWVALPK